MANKPIEGNEIIKDGALDNHIKELNEALKVYEKIDAQIVQIAKDTKKMSQSLSAGTAGDIKLAQQQNKALTSAIVEQERVKRAKMQTEKSLISLNKARETQRKREIKQQEQLTNVYKQESKQLNDLRNQYKNLAAQNKANTKEARGMLKEITRLDTKLKAIDKTVGQSQRNVGNYTSAWNNLRRTLIGGLGLTVGIAGLGRAIRSISTTISGFQQESANLAAVLGKSRDEITALTDDAKRLGSTTAFTASQVVQLQTAFSKLGFNEDQILNATEATLDLAAATGTDLDQAATVVASTLNGFGEEADQAARLSDVMAKSFSTTALDMEKFSTSMAIVAPVANTANMSIEETTALLGTLVDAGVDASTAGTGLRNIFLDVAKSGGTMDDALNKIRNSTNKNATAMDLFGKRGATVATILAENTEKAAELTKGFENAAGAAEEMANEQLDTLSGAMTKLSSAWEGFILSLEDGEGVLATTIRRGIDELTEFIQLLSDLTLSTEQLQQKRLQTRQDIGTESAQSRAKILSEFVNASKEEIELAISELEESDESQSSILKAFLANVEAGASRQEAKIRALSELAQAAKNQAEEAGKILEDVEGDAQSAIVGGFFDGATRDVAQLESTVDESLKSIRTELKKFSDEELQAFELTTTAAARARRDGQELTELQKREVAINTLIQQEKTRRKEVDGIASIEEKTNKTIGGSDGTVEKVNELARLKKELNSLEVDRTNELIKNNGLESQKTVELAQQIRTLRDQIKVYENISKSVDKIQRVESRGEGLDISQPITTVTGVDEPSQAVEETEDAAQQIADISNQVTNLLRANLDRRLEMLNEEEAAEQRKADAAVVAQERIIAARNAGVTNAEESLAFERKAEAEALAEQERIQKRKQRLQLFNAGIEAFNAQVQQGSTNAAGSTISQLGTLLSFLSAIPAFWEGTETTVGDSLGNKVHNGRDGILARVDKDEIILNKEKSDKLKGLTTDQITNYALMYQNGVHGMERRSVTAIPTFSDPKMYQQLKENNALLKTIANKPVIDNSAEIVGKVLHFIKKETSTGKTTTTIHKTRLR